jgi:DNA-binding SARP family transcriptional activator
VEYRILGPIEVVASGRAVNLGGPRQRRVLAALLIHANQVVPVERLVAAVWDGEPPATADKQVRNGVAALRTALTRRGGLIDTLGDGYRLRVDAGELDAVIFRDLVERGRANADAAVLREALGLWRGSALAGLRSAELAAAAARLDEERLAAQEELSAVDLAAGAYQQVIRELQPLVAAHPLRERLVAHLVTALHRSGRTDHARALYAGTAARLADELGVDPGADLRLARDAVSGVAPVRPSQLPADVTAFTGRRADLQRLDALATRGLTGRPW